ncbi:hypothetical protein PInf_003945 [Phytophthora infestans]|nr:hypothetical protein PInf_003945 [Phytophthora infestans]
MPQDAVDAVQEVGANPTAQEGTGDASAKRVGPDHLAAEAGVQMDEEEKGDESSDLQVRERMDDSASTSDAATVIIDPPVKYHANWEAWQSYFTEYCRRTMQVIPVKETMSRAERNKRLKKTKKGLDEN